MEHLDGFENILSLSYLANRVTVIDELCSSVLFRTRPQTNFAMKSVLLLDFLSYQAKVSVSLGPLRVPDHFYVRGRQLASVFRIFTLDYVAKTPRKTPVLHATTVANGDTLTDRTVISFHIGPEEATPAMTGGGSAQFRGLVGNAHIMRKYLRIVRDNSFPQCRPWRPDQSRVTAVKSIQISSMAAVSS